MLFKGLDVKFDIMSSVGMDSIDFIWSLTCVAMDFWLFSFPSLTWCIDLLRFIHASYVIFHTEEILSTVFVNMNIRNIAPHWWII